MNKLFSLLLVIGISNTVPSYTIPGKQIVKDITSPFIDATKSVGTWMYRHPVAAMSLTNIPAFLYLVASVSSYQSCAKSIDTYHNLYTCQESLQNKLAVGAATYLGLNGLLYVHAITAPIIDGVTLTGKWIYNHPKFCLLTAAALVAAGAAQDI
jgi:hypothetical protein